MELDSLVGFEDMPLEAKMEVFRKLKDPQDLKHSWNVCASWHSALNNRKREFLLPGVLLSIQSYLSQADLQNCREMCPVWKEGVDGFLQTTKSRFWLTSITSFQKLDKFNKDMESYKVNPFPSRKLMFGKPMHEEFLIENEEEDEEKLYGSFTSFASDFGEHVWELVYLLDRHCTMSANQVVSIPSYFRNLKDLTFYEGMGEVGENDCIRTIKDIIQNIPEDDLAFSKMTGFKCLLHNGAPILNAVVGKYGSQLERLHCFGDSMALEILSDIGRHLPNIKILKMFHCTFSIFSNRYSILSQLPLRMLKLEFSDDELDVIEIEKLINGIPTSIVNLSLMAHFKFGLNDSPDFEGLLERPELKYLNIPSLFLDTPSILSKILTNFGSIEHLRLTCPSHLKIFERDFDTFYVNLVVKNLFLKCLTLQSVELISFKADNFNQRIHKFNRKRTTHTRGTK